jgi:hypothetical protein
MKEGSWETGGLFSLMTNYKLQMTNGAWRVRWAILILILILFLTAENTELAESFSLGSISKKNEKVLPSGFSMIWQCCH